MCIFILTKIHLKLQNGVQNQLPISFGTALIPKKVLKGGCVPASQKVFKGWMCPRIQEGLKVWRCPRIQESVNWVAVFPHPRKPYRVDVSPQPRQC